MKVRLAITAFSAPAAALLSALVLGANVAAAHGVFRGDALWTVSFAGGPLVVTAGLSTAATALDVSNARTGLWWPPTSRARAARTGLYAWAANAGLMWLAWALVMAVTLTLYPPVTWPSAAQTALVLACQAAFIGTFAALGALIGQWASRVWAMVGGLVAGLALANWGTSLTAPAWNVTLGWLSPAHLVAPNIGWHAWYVTLALATTAALLALPHTSRRSGQPRPLAVLAAAAGAGALLFAGGSITTARWDNYQPLASECATSTLGARICVVPQQRDFLPSLTTGIDAILASAPGAAAHLASGIVTDGAASSVPNAAPFSPSVTSFRDRAVALPELAQAVMPARCDAGQDLDDTDADALDLLFSRTVDGIMVAVASNSSSPEVAAFTRVRGPEDPEDFTFDDYLALAPQDYTSTAALPDALAALASCDAHAAGVLVQ